MAGLPDPNASRVVLIGTGRYASNQLPDIPAARNNLFALAEAFRSKRVWGLPHGSCVVVADPSTSVEMLDPVAAAAAEATDTLIVYYTGHGLVDPKRGELHLALTTTSPDRMYSAVPYDNVRDLLLDSRSARRIVVLDCCYSGRAVGALADPATAVVDEASAEGTYILAAAAENKVALAPPGEPFTAFTGELLGIFRQGIAGKGELLDLDTIYGHVLASMRERARPLPQKRDRNTAGLISLVWNQAHPKVVASQQAERQLLHVNSGVDEVISGLLTQAQAPDPVVRRQAAASLGALGNTEQPVLDTLRRLAASDPDRSARLGARNALLLLGEAGAFGMVRIPAGEFVMGTSDRQRAYLRRMYGWEGSWTYSESPERRIGLPEYFIDRTPVTNAQFAEFVADTGYRTVAEVTGSGHVKRAGADSVQEVRGVNWAQPKGPGSSWQEIPDHPVVLLCWPDVTAYAEWAGKRLPTEPQWEKAARGTDGRLWPWGDEWQEGLCNTAQFHVRRTTGGRGNEAQWWIAFDQLTDGPLTTPVGSFPEGASPYGLLDCAGNVCERTSDWYKGYPDGWDASEHYGEKYHVLRGGAFHHGPELARAAARDFAHPLFRTFHDGFRCVVDPADLLD